MEECYAEIHTEDSLTDEKTADKRKSAQEALTERMLTEDEFIRIFSQWLEPWLLMYNTECKSADNSGK
ncbi:MAG: hypothetical protein IJK60_00990 [Clostridia bacterium]|nr:hypothetical protein [Clostridia bacterium]